jgi:hypothetical protein
LLRGRRLAGSALLRGHAFQEIGALLRGLGLLLVGALLRGSTGAGAGRAALGLVVGLALVRPDHHDHVAAVQLGLRLDETQFLDVLG